MSKSNLNTLLINGLPATLAKLRAITRKDKVTYNNMKVLDCSMNDTGVLLTVNNLSFVIDLPNK